MFITRHRWSSDTYRDNNAREIARELTRTADVERARAAITRNIVRVSTEPAAASRLERACTVTELGCGARPHHKRRHAVEAGRGRSANRSHARRLALLHTARSHN